MGIFSREKDNGSSDFDNASPAGGSDVQEGVMSDNADSLQRHLNNRQIQLIAIGGSIGTALFISIGNGLAFGGPASLLLAFASQSIMLALVNNCLAEMTTAFPVSGGFIRLAGKWVDDALGFMTGWNFFFYEALLIPFEITAINLIISFWAPNVTDPGPTAGICIACIVLYAAINILAVEAYGEAEFWLCGGKVVLIFALFFFTFVTMVGGNPQGDAYGFRYWQTPGAFAEYLSDGRLGRFEGYLACLWNAAFAVVGPEYISMVAAEAKRPRHYIKSAFKMVYLRFGLFFIGSAIAVGVVVPYDNDDLQAIANGDKSSATASASPYVIAMENLGVDVFPHIVNVLILTSIFSAGNTYTYCAVRNLYALALEGRAPKILAKTTRQGVPIYAFFIVMLFPFLSLLQVGGNSAEVLDWLVSLITAGALIDYLVMCITYIAFYKACQAQGLNRQELPYTGWFQPYGAYIASAWMFAVTMCYGYEAFKPGWNTRTFFTSYTMVIVDPILYVFWKVLKRTKIIPSAEVDLVWERPTIDAYEAGFLEPPVGFWTEICQMVGLRKNAGGSDKRAASVSVEPGKEEKA